MLFIVTSIVVALFIQQSIQQQELNLCKIKNSNTNGICVDFYNCEYAQRMVKQGQNPQTCGFVNDEVRVCCPKRPSEKFCYKYYKQFQFFTAVFNGQKALGKEFPHMAALGYGEAASSQWLCGGSLISENFVLTAAHCIKSPDFGNVQRVRLGDLDLNDDKDDAQPQDFQVKNVYIHPNYKSSLHYHDIALIELDKKAEINDYVKPACLPSTNLKTELIANLSVTGWGKTDFVGEKSSHLLKTNVNLLSYDACSKRFPKLESKKLNNGIVQEMQMCAGHSDGNDSCQGDSGGPLNLKVESAAPKFFYVMGITSFGKACGVENSAGVYTKVSNYLDWIEGIVWKDLV